MSVLREVCILIAETDYLRKVLQPVGVCVLHDAIVRQVNPGLLVHDTELLGHGGDDASGHAAVRHHGNDAGEMRILHPFDAAAYAQDCFAAALGGQPEP